jgi:hypothetical protein
MTEEYQFSLTKGGYYQSIEMLPIKLWLLVLFNLYLFVTELTHSF